MQHLQIRFNEDELLLNKIMPLANAAAILTKSEAKIPLACLKLLTDLFPDQLQTLKTALARIATAKQHSADMERLIIKILSS